MSSLRSANLDQRVHAILTDPDGYFTAALERAWTVARLEVDLDLAQRARARHVGTRLSAARGPVGSGASLVADNSAEGC